MSERKARCLHPSDDEGPQRYCHLVFGHYGSHEWSSPPLPAGIDTPANTLTAERREMAFRAGFGGPTPPLCGKHIGRKNKKCEACQRTELWNRVVAVVWNVAPVLRVDLESRLASHAPLVALVRSWQEARKAKESHEFGHAYEVGGDPEGVALVTAERRAFYALANFDLGKEGV